TTDGSACAQADTRPRASPMRTGTTASPRLATRMRTRVSTPGDTLTAVCGTTISIVMRPSMDHVARVVVEVRGAGLGGRDLLRAAARHVVGRQRRDLGAQ